MTDIFQERIELIKSQEKAYSKLLPEHIKAEKFTEVALNFFRDPEKEKILQTAEINSILAAIAKAAKDGLLLDSKEAAISLRSKNIGTKQNPQWIKIGVYSPMVTGIIKLARNSGAISTLSARMVYENEKFDFWVEDGVQKMIHKPILFGDKGNIKGVYACAVQKDGELVLDALDNAEIAKRRKMAETDYIWAAHPEEMAKKSALHKLKKLLDLSSDQKLSEALDLANDFQEEQAQEKEEKATSNTWFKEGSEGAEAEAESKAKAKEPVRAEPEKEPVKKAATKKAAPAKKTLSLKEQGQEKASLGRDALRAWYSELGEKETEEVNAFIQELIEAADGANFAKVPVKKSEPQQTEQEVEEDTEDDYEEVPFDADDSEVDDVM